MGNEIKLCWLGQSGFQISGGGIEILVDPYLSDSCAKIKSKLDHTRGTPIVRAPETLKVDYYLITHNHADHFDPETAGHWLGEKGAIRVLAPSSVWQKVSGTTHPKSSHQSSTDA